jgi:hypothetical protein
VPSLGGGGGHRGQSHRQCYFATDGQSVLAFSLSGIHDQILAVVKTAAVLSYGVLPEP